ncbi:alpha/beta hydrolase [Nocardia sp. CA-128927]|uniref:alpha/beta hydrolase n=1 Tax=Nocardia sp. CA-128927 TaxID=3239975 RepID=UPI003D987031
MAAATAAVVTGVITGAGMSAAVPTETIPAAGVQRFYHQQLTWQPCHDDALDQAGAQCAEVRVPLNYAAPEGRTIAIAISRIRAAVPAARRGAMMTNPGGPGGAGLSFIVEASSFMPPEFHDNYDLIGMDPRGVGRSAPVHCHWPIGLSLFSAGADRASFARSVQTHADLAARCQTAEPDVLPFITTRNTARDVDVIRGVLGEQRISYFGLSYGPYLGAVFAQMFPDRVDRLLFDSAVDPDRYGVAQSQDMGAPNEAALDAGADWIAARDGEYHLGTTRSEVRSAVAALIDHAAWRPIRIGEHSVEGRWIPTLLFVALADPRRYDALAATIRELTDAAAGTPVQPNPQLDEDLRFILTAQPDDMAANSVILCGDVSAPRDPQWYWRNIEASRATQPVFGPFANNISPCAFWPAPVEPPTAVRNAVPALILQATGDPRTAYQGGVALHHDMPASRLVTLQDAAVHGVSLLPSACVRQAVAA